MKACPFCGGYKIRVLPIGGELWQAWCTTCDATGPTCGGTDERPAATLWGVRSEIKEEETPGAGILRLVQRLSLEIVGDIATEHLTQRLEDPSKAAMKSFIGRLLSDMEARMALDKSVIRGAVSAAVRAFPDIKKAELQFPAGRMPRVRMHLESGDVLVAVLPTTKAEAVLLKLAYSVNKEGQEPTHHELIRNRVVSSVDSAFFSRVPEMQIEKI